MFKELEKTWQKHKHLLLVIVIVFCAYLLYQKHYGIDLSKTFEALPFIGGAAYGLNFLINLTK